MSRGRAHPGGRGFVLRQPSGLWAIVRKDVLEIFRARGTYYYIPAMLVMSSFFFINYSDLTKALGRQNASPAEAYLATKSFLNTVAYLLPLLYCLFASNLTSAGLIFEKQKRSLESLLVTSRQRQASLDREGSGGRPLGICHRTGGRGVRLPCHGLW